MISPSRWRPAAQAGEERLTIKASGWNGPLPGAIACGVLGAYFLAEAFLPLSVFRLLLGLAFELLAVRMWRRSRLVLSDDHVEWHTMLRTWRWPTAAVDHFEVATRRTNASAPPVRALRMHLCDGRAQWLRGLEETRSPSDSLIPERWRFAQPDLDEVVGVLNELVQKPHHQSRQREAG